MNSCRACAMVNESSNYLQYEVITIYFVYNCLLDCIHMCSKHFCSHECSDISPNTLKEIHYITPKMKVAFIHCAPVPITYADMVSL